MTRGGRGILLTCILAMQSPFCDAQGEVYTKEPPSYTWQEFVEEMADDEYAEEQGWTESMEELALLAAHPMDVNTASRDQLGKLPFLSDEQIEDIHTYILLHQGMRSLGELMAIESLDIRTRQYLTLFLRADEGVFERQDTLTLKSILRKAHHEVTTRLDIPLYYRLGYSYPPQRGGYSGSTLYNNVRYRLEEKKHLSLGVTAEKDQGEPFRHNSGWDHYGAYLMVRNVGVVHAAIVGDYKMGFGEGLVVNTGFFTGKTSLVKRPSQGIRAKRGMDEVNYFRGAAVTFGIGKVNLSAWISHRKLDASLNDDGTLKTLQTSGLHRTLSELDQKHNAGTIMAGGNLSWRYHGFHLGTTGYYQRFHRELSPGNAIYRRIYPRGKNFGVVGINYGYSHLWFNFSGETAYSTERGGWATLERATWKINPQYALSGSYRFYSYRYYSFHASALSENSNVQNESGATLRIDANPANNLNMTAYIDFFYNPWPRYTVAHSSKGQEACLQGEYTFHRNNRLTARYQLKRKERSNQMELHNRLRLQYTRQQGHRWLLQSMVNLHTMDRVPGIGWSVSQRTQYKHESLQLSSLLTYFHTPDYQTRIFLYEPLLTDMFRFPSLYGHGLRFVAAAHYRMWHRRLLVEVLYGMTRYFDRNSQSSGMQEIRSPWKQDISVQFGLTI